MHRHGKNIFRLDWLSLIFRRQNICNRTLFTFGLVVKKSWSDNSQDSFDTFRIDFQFNYLNIA
jgi:hypothetical protein